MSCNLLLLLLLRTNELLLEVTSSRPAHPLRIMRVCCALNRSMTPAEPHSFGSFAVARDNGAAGALARGSFGRIQSHEAAERRDTCSSQG